MKYKILLCLFFVPMLLGCLPVINTTPLPNTNTPFALIITATSKPATLTPTELVTSLPETTPLPTLVSENAPLTIKELLESNGNCQLPCWWGIIPGQTSWSSAKGFLSPIAENLYEDSKENLQIIFSEVFIPAPSPYTGSFSSRYYAQNNIVQEIEILPQNFSKYSFPRNALHELGVPEKVYLSGLIDKQYQYFQLTLYYPSRGVFILYATEVHPYQKQELVNVCFDQIEYVDIWLWNPETWSFSDTFNFLYKEYGSSFTEINDVTNIDISEFYDKFSNSEQKGCLETPFEHWFVN